MNYRKLLGRIVEVFGSQTGFTDAYGVAPSWLSLRLAGKLEWKASEMAKACELLNIPLTEIHLYFFTRNA